MLRLVPDPAGPDFLSFFLMNRVEPARMYKTSRTRPGTATPRSRPFLLSEIKFNMKPTRFTLNLVLFVLGMLPISVFSRQDRQITLEDIWSKNNFEVRTVPGFNAL